MIFAFLAAAFAGGLGGYVGWSVLDAILAEDIIAPLPDSPEDGGERG